MKRIQKTALSAMVGLAFVAMGSAQSQSGGPQPPAAGAVKPASAVAVAVPNTNALATVASPVTDGKGISDGVIRIGVLTDMSSLYALGAGPGAVVAARMAVEDFGKKMVHGARIEIIIADDQNSTLTAAARTKEWVERYKVDMITGAVATSAALGSIQEASKYRKPVFGIASSSSSLTNAACNPYMLQWMHDTYGLSKGTIEALIKEGKKTFFFITADYAFGMALEKDATALVKANGGEVKGSIRAPFPGADFTVQLLAAKNSGAQVIAFANAGLDAVGTTLQAKKMGLTPKQAIAPLLLYHQDVQSLGAEVLQDQFMTTGYVWNQNAESIAFARRYYARTHRMPDITQAGVYSSVLQYLKAVDALGTDDGDAIMIYFKDPKTIINDAIIQNGSVRKDGKLMKAMILLRFKKPSEMAHKWDYYDIKKVISPVDVAIPLENSTCSFITKPPQVYPGVAFGSLPPGMKPASAAISAVTPAAPAAPAAPTAEVSTVKPVVPAALAAVPTVSASGSTKPAGSGDKDGKTAPVPSVQGK